MKPQVYFLFCLLCSLSVIGQTDATKEVVFEPLLEGLEHSDLNIKVSTLTEAILQAGISFDFDKERLGAILAAGKKGGRDPKEMAELILATFRVCQTCRGQVLEPLTIQELKALTSWNFAPSAINEEARVRGVKDLQVSKAAADDLRSVGISDEVIAVLVPDD